jgi:hypothetical protein
MCKMKNVITMICNEDNLQVDCLKNVHTIWQRKKKQQQTKQSSMK